MDGKENEDILNKPRSWADAAKKSRIIGKNGTTLVFKLSLKLNIEMLKSHFNSAL